MKFSVILPARLSSTRLPEKALADIAGKPMIVRAAEQALQSCAQNVWVATDHERIQAACKAHQIACVMTRPDHESGTTRLAEAVTALGLADDEIIVNVQGDEPLIPPALIKQVAETLAHSTAPMATAAHRIHEIGEWLNPNCVKVLLNQQNQAICFSRAPVPYPRDAMLAGETKLPDTPPLRHIGIYAYRVDFLKQYCQLSESSWERDERLEQLRVLWHGFPIVVAVVDDVPPAGVDTSEDLARVRQYFSS